MRLRGQIEIMTNVPNDARRTKATSKCSTCGHEWPSGQEGTHLCETKLLLKIEALEKDLNLAVEVIEICGQDFEEIKATQDT